MFVPIKKEIKKDMKNSDKKNKMIDRVDVIDSEKKKVLNATISKIEKDFGKDYGNDAWR